jgi:hypothetical protein
VPVTCLTASGRAAADGIRMMTAFSATIAEPEPGPGEDDDDREQAS